MTSFITALFACRNIIDGTRVRTSNTSPNPIVNGWCLEHATRSSKDEAHIWVNTRVKSMYRIISSTNLKVVQESEITTDLRSPK